MIDADCWYISNPAFPGRRSAAVSLSSTGSPSRPSSHITTARYSGPDRLLISRRDRHQRERGRLDRADELCADRSSKRTTLPTDLGDTPMTEPTTQTLDVPGAVLTWDVRRNNASSGPALMLIGSPMGAAGFATLAG